jgi:predicted small metal-binding protein
MSRVMADCRRFESDMNCTLTIIGEEAEVVIAAAEHAASVHGHENTPELQQQIRDMLEPESGYVQGERQAEAFPG